MTRLYARDTMKFNITKIEEDKRWLRVNAVISAVGVYDYPDGVAFKSAPELLAATRTARYAKLTINDHPDTLVIMSQDQLYGGVREALFDNPKMRALLEFDKTVTPEVFLRKVRLAASRKGETLDNSIGFYYRPDFTPGKAKDVNTGKMRSYDYAMRDIVVDHVAVGSFEGRCSSPVCGIAVDVAMRRIALNPFGKYEDMQDCINKNQDKKSPAGFCAWLHKKITGKYPGQSAEDAALFQLIGDITKLDNETYFLIFGDNDRPPKAWCDNCESKAKSFADDPEAFCGWLWHHGPENLKNSFGASSVSNERRKTGMSQETETEYAKCIREKKAGGLTEDEAKEACKDLKTDQDEVEDAYQKCIADKKKGGMTQEEAEKACAALKPTGGDVTCLQKAIANIMNSKGKTLEQAVEQIKKDVLEADQEQTPWQKCIAKYMSEEGGGLTAEEAAEKCKEDGVAQDQETVAQPVEHEEPLPTELEQCIASRMEAHGEDEATAKKWCEDEIAGLHQPAADIVDEIERLKAKERDLRNRRR